MVRSEHNFALQKFGVQNLTIQECDYTKLSNVRFTDPSEKTGVLFEFPMFTPNQVSKEVTVEFFKRYLNLEGNPIGQVKNDRFKATTQENFGYFFSLTTSQPIGEALIQRQISGFLTYYFSPDPSDRFQQIVCFSASNGAFYPPSTISVAVEGSTIVAELIDAPGGEETYSFMLISPETVNPYAPAFSERLTSAQASPIFENVEPGEYVVMATSTHAMPCFARVTVSEPEI